MAYGDFNDLTRRTVSDKILCDKTCNIAKNPKYDVYQRGLASMVYKFFDEKTSGGTVKNENISNKELAEELHKPIIKKFKKRKVQSPFIDNMWGADVADMQLISKFNKGNRFLLCAIDIYSKYAWVIAFQKILDESSRREGCKPNKIWVDKGSKFYNRSIKSWLEKNAIERHSRHSERKSVIAERFIRTLKNKIYKYMTSISINVYIDKLDKIINPTIHIIAQLK